MSGGNIDPMAMNEMQGGEGTGDLSSWREKLAAFGEEEGFYRPLGARHDALFVKRGKTLVVTFENLDHVFENNEDRMPWGYKFVTRNNWSMLGMMAHEWTWYRDEAVCDFFDELRDSGFFGQFNRVVFYGASMGGYAACAFSSAAKDAIIVAISPQSTLDPKIVPWEKRYARADSSRFNSRYGFAPDEAAAAKRFYLFYDPFNPPDKGHADLFVSPNVSKLTCRFAGHRIASLWIKLGLLQKIIIKCVNDDLSPKTYHHLMRARRNSPRFQRLMLKRLEERGGDRLIMIYCDAVMRSRGNAPNFKKARKAARLRLKAAKEAQKGKKS